MNKKYIFLILIAIMLYLIFLILSSKFNDYKVNSEITENTKLNIELKNIVITELESNLKYKNTKAYKSKVRKGQQQEKNKNEVAVILTKETTYNKFTKEKIEPNIDHIQIKNEYNITDNMTIYQKWMYFLFKKEI